jgi:hypothetical protein
MSSCDRDAVLPFAQNKVARSPATIGVASATSAALPTHTATSTGEKRLALWPGGVTLTPSMLVGRHNEASWYPGLAVQRVVLATPSGPSRTLRGNNSWFAIDGRPTSVPPASTHLAIG